VLAISVPACIPPLSLHDALPIWCYERRSGTSRPVSGTFAVPSGARSVCSPPLARLQRRPSPPTAWDSARPLSSPPSAPASSLSRSEEHTSELQSRFDLVRRLLPE